MSEPPTSFEVLLEQARSADRDVVDRAHATAVQRMRAEPRMREVAAAAYDRARVLTGRPQKFGTQAVTQRGELALWPVDPTTTDTERAKWGLAPLLRLQEQLGEAALADKQTLRRALRQRRAELSAGARAEAALQLQERGLEALGARCAGKVVAAYWPLSDELDPRPLARALSSGHGARLSLPVVQGEEMAFRSWEGDAALQPAGFGTLGPGPDAPALRPDVVLAPLVGCDRGGGRLGQGKGCYDRALARLDADGGVLVVGVAFSCQLVAAVPTDAHDRPLDAVLTEREWIALSA